jgi:hypothetical protein
MSAKIIPFKSASAPANTSADFSMNAEAVRAAVQELEAIDHDLQLKLHAVNIAIGETRRERLELLRLLDSSRSA